MTPEQFKRAEQLYFEAHDLTAGERTAFLEQQCADDELVRQRVERMLTQEDETVAFREVRHGVADAMDHNAPGSVGLRSGDRVGRYRVVREIGAGGMGIVYEAEQLEPIKRRVALKLIKIGMDTREVVARFESERQALALMDHPNVAAVLDAGATEQGRPYFVMEYVPGEPITAYCDQHRLSLAERLKLFTQVCSAIQHAHQKGLIHRDIKPGNVLVRLHDEEPTPVVIDFGVAKATDQELTEQTFFTQHGALVGTPEYMSPEQAAGSALDVDTRTDVYSLGVLLYELLTGTLPFDARTLRQAGLAAIQGLIREVEPPRPSTRLGQLRSKSGDETGSLAAEQRRLDPWTLARRLRGDLDWIVMKALEKDRTRRYGSAPELAADVQRHLDQQPVAAGPPGAAYRLSKFARRNRVAVLAASAVLIAMFVGAVGLTTGLVRARAARDDERHQRQLAEKESQRAQATTEFLETILTAPAYDGYDVTVSEVLAAAEARLATLEVVPEAETEILRVIGEASQAIGQYDEAGRHLRRAHELCLATGREEDAAVLGSALGSLLLDHGDAEEAEALLRDSLEVLQQSGEQRWADQAAALVNLGEHHMNQAGYSEAEQLFAQARDLVLAHASGEPRQLGPALAGLAAVRYFEGQLDQSVAAYEQALAAMTAGWGAAHQNTLTVLYNLAYLQAEQGKSEVAEGLYQRTITQAREHLGDDHPHLAALLESYGSHLANRNQPAKALPLLQDAYRIRKSRLGRRHAATIQTAGNLINVLVKLPDHWADAEPLARLRLSDVQDRHGPDSRETLAALFNLNQALSRLQQHTDEAEQLGRRELELWMALEGPGHFNTWASAMRFADLLANREKYEEATEILAEAIRYADLNPGDGYFPSCLRRGHGYCLMKLGRFQDAEASLLRSHELITELNPRHRDVRLVSNYLVQLYEAWHVAQADEGYDAEAAEWHGRLEERQTSSQPSKGQ